MRVSKQKKQDNHDRIVEFASELFRERGFDGVGVAEVMERAGLTHGGFYDHFASKDALIAEALVKTFKHTTRRYAGYSPEGVIDVYLSRTHRDTPGQGCPAAALSGEAARLPGGSRSAFAPGLENLLEGLERSVAEQAPAAPDIRAKAITILAQAVGAVMLSRACPDTSGLADEFLETCRAECLRTLASP